MGQSYQRTKLHPPISLRASILLTILVSVTAVAQSSCSSTLTPTSSAQLTVASGYGMNLVATGLTSPRGIQFDSNGNLLVVEKGRGISWLSLADNGGACVSVRDSGTVISDNSLNHGIEMSTDGKTLYASSSKSAWSWDYNATDRSVSRSRKALVINMETSDHTTRTLLLSRKVSGTLLVSRGSMSNIDLDAAKLSSGHSQIRAFNLNNLTDGGYDYSTQGLRLGWGLRNSVGMAEHPVTGGIYSVENSVDNIERGGTDIHEDNPGEELNFHGYLNGTEYAPQGGNYGYPFCAAAWVVNDIPNHDKLTLGSQFALDIEGNTQNDSYCAAQNAPRLTFQAHTAPLDIKFNNSGTEGWVTFHGSWDRTDPVGYKLSVIPFRNGEPVAAPDNNTAAIDIFMNKDTSVCPQQCVRPVGIAFDSRGRLFVSSDATGEIYVIVRESGTTGGANPSRTGSAPAASSSRSAAVALGHWPARALLPGLAFPFLWLLQ